MIGDAEFDALLPPGLRAAGKVHFSPAAVARRAAELLVVTPGAWVLDVGAAVGKFCIVAASTRPDAVFVGIERRRHLVRVATTIAKQLAVDNVIFAHGDLVDVDWTRFQAFYLFNPFAEHLRDAPEVLDRSIELDPAHFEYYVEAVTIRLDAAAAGTRVVTYHGFGWEPPDGYVLELEEPIGTERLELWVKR